MQPDGTQPAAGREPHARPDPTTSTISAVLLCGGAGRRMGGADKPLLDWQGRPLIEHVAARIRPQVNGLLISANRNLERYAAYGEVVTDTIPGYAGPLAGILAALTVCRTPWLLACPGDAPDLPCDLVTRLVGALCAAPTRMPPRAAVACDGERVQPLPLLTHVSVRAGLAAWLETGQRSVRAWLATLEPAIADFPGAAAAFRSRNTVADLCGAPHVPNCDCK